MVKQPSPPASYALRFGIALASILLLAGPPALATDTASCEDAWEDSSASETCKEPDILFGDWQGCLQCCSIFAKCHTGNSLSPDPYMTTGIAVTLSEVDGLENCLGTLTSGSC